jgi:pimeloyl-ACP methyl ester carboxylesterase
MMDHHRHRSGLLIFFLFYNFSSSAATLQQPNPNINLPIVILPGFGNASRDYDAPFGNVDASLVAALGRRGFENVHVVPIERKDWIKVGKMIFTTGYWTGNLNSTDPGYTWYLERVKETVETAQKNATATASATSLDSTFTASGASPLLATKGGGNNKVVLIGHSAGGWLARAYLGQEQFKSDSDDENNNKNNGVSSVPNEAIGAIVTLGTPHSPPPPRSKVKDMTGGALKWVNETWPGAYYASQGVKYIAVGSKAVIGDRKAGRQTLPGYSFASYRQVLGRGHNVEGDAVVPLKSALLEGARHVVLDDVLHSMSRLGTFEEDAGDGVKWYGSESIVDQWLEPLLAP